MKLNKECIEAIDEQIDESVSNRNDMILGCQEALTNPSIYSKAGLISLEDAFGFAEWLPKQLGLGYSIEDKAWFSNSGKSRHEIAQLFQIFQDTKNK